jgi:hypothetical protein
MLFTDNKRLNIAVDTAELLSPCMVKGMLEPKSIFICPAQEQQQYPRR